MTLFKRFSKINRQDNSCYFSSKSHFYSLIVLFTVLLINSCTDEPAATSPVLDKTVIMPLQVGNYWTYKEITYDDAGNGKKNDVITGVILKSIVVNDEELFRLDYVISLSDTLSTENKPSYFINKENGLNIYYKNSSNSEPVLFLKYPVSKGESYLFLETGNKFTVKDLNFKYTVPSGTFECIMYVLILPTSWNQNDLQLCFYYSPGIGEIAFEEYEKTNTDSLKLKYKRVLLSYKLN